MVLYLVQEGVERAGYRLPIVCSGNCSPWGSGELHKR